MTTADEAKPKSRTRWPFGLLGMLALVAAAERYIEGRSIEFGTMTTIEWRLTAKAVKKKEAARAELLCFGTSLNRLGLSPVILEEKTGLRAYDLALSGAQPYATYLMLRHALESGANPKAIVVDFKWTSVFNHPVGLEQILPEIGSLAECSRLALAMNDYSYLGRLALVKTMPSFAYRLAIRDNIAAATAGKEPVRNEQWAVMSRNMKVNKGAYHTPKVPYDGSVETNDKAFFPEVWVPNPVNERYVHEFLTLAESRHIPVFLVISPISPATKAQLDGAGVTASYTEFVRGVLAKHPGVVALDARESGYPVAAFYDSTHPNRYGTAELSRTVAEAIMARLGTVPAEKIVALPPYSGGPGQERLEDVWDSYNWVTRTLKEREAGRVADAKDGTSRR